MSDPRERLLMLAVTLENGATLSPPSAAATGRAFRVLVEEHFMASEPGWGLRAAYRCSCGAPAWPCPVLERAAAGLA